MHIFPRPRPLDGSYGWQTVWSLGCMSNILSLNKIWGTIKIWWNTQKFACFGHRLISSANKNKENLTWQQIVTFIANFFLWMILPEQCNGPIINKLYCHFYAHYGKVGNKLGTLLPYFIWLPSKQPLPKCYQIFLPQ